MKKNWINTLIKLLNEFRPVVSCFNFKEHYEFIDDDIYLIREWIDWEEEQFPMYVCYKKWDFIKWLVENNKIDFDKVYEKEENENIDICMSWKDADMYWLLMLLSIQDNPIEFLISILK